MNDERFEFDLHARCFKVVGVTFTNTRWKGKERGQIDGNGMSSDACKYISVG